MLERFCVYYRVSTKKQGRSGLGLLAQKEIVERFLQTRQAEVIGEFTDIESGGSDTREQLARALHQAKLTGAKLLIARLDRFSRRVSFIARMMDEGVPLVLAEMPDCTEFQLHIFAALAQEERRLVRSRTKLALHQAKLRGVQLGKHGKVLALTRIEEAVKRAETLRSVVEPLRASGYGITRICSKLNQDGYRTPTGKQFFPEQEIGRAHV